MNNTLELSIVLQHGEFTLQAEQVIGLSGITAIFGASGSGKTSLLRVIAGLEEDATGSINFRGQVWLDQRTRMPTEKRRTGYVFHDGRLFSHLDVQGNLRFAMRQAASKPAISLNETIDALDLAALLHRDTRSLSNGERQRVAIGRSLLAAPELLLMDEPLSSLDRARRSELLPLIQSLPERFGLPVIYVTHDLDELLQLADSVILMAEGRCHAHGKPREILERDDFAELADLETLFCLLETTVLRHENKLTVTQLGEQQLKVPALQARPGDRVRLLVNPDNVILATSKPEGISIRNCLTGRLTDLRLSGNGQCVAEIAVADQKLAALVTEDAAIDLELKIGSTVHALIKTVAITAFNSPDQNP